MRKYVFLLLILFSLPVFAGSEIPPLDVVSFQLQAEQWATTKTAKVIVSINASVDSSKLGQIPQLITNKLSTLSTAATWHITSFQRSKDRSGLEKINAYAEARLSELELTGLREKAKKISSQGEQYTIAEIRFIPSPLKIQKVQRDLRVQIYQKVRNELKQLNKLYPSQHYLLHKVNFITSNSAPIRAMVAYKVSRSATSSMSVSNKVFVMANIEFAANRH